MVMTATVQWSHDVGTKNITFGLHNQLHGCLQLHFLLLCSSIKLMWYLEYNANFCEQNDDLLLQP